MATTSATTTSAAARGYDSTRYRDAQTAAIKERLSKFQGGKLYLEVGGKLLFDGHASRVLPGFEPDVKVKMLQNLGIRFEILFCVSARDIEAGRVWGTGDSYEDAIWATFKEYDALGLPRPKLVFNLSEPGQSRAAKLEEALKAKGFEVSHRYPIAGYPNDVDKIVSDDGYGKDEHIATADDCPLVVVTGLGSSSGKLSTCMGQVYLDRTLKQQTSGYAKYELFPIWDLPLPHPINLAYEAATADIGDFNAIDKFHKEAYGIESVNYNRDIGAFPILANLVKRVSDPNGFMLKYKSPTDMGTNTAKQGIIDDAACIAAAIAEVKSRKVRYAALIEKGQGEQVWVDRCDRILERCLEYKPQ